MAVLQRKSLFNCIFRIIATNRPRKKNVTHSKAHLHVTDLYHRWCHFHVSIVLYQRR